MTRDVIRVTVAFVSASSHLQFVEDARWIVLFLTFA